MAIEVEVSTNFTWEDINKMTREELAKIVYAEVSKLNKRLRRIRDKEMIQESGAYKYAMETGGYFSAKGKNRNELLAEYRRMQKFKNMETSSLTGIKNLKKRMGKLMGIDWRLPNFNEVLAKTMRLLHGMQSEDFGDIHLYGYEKAVKNIAQRVMKGESGIKSSVYRDMERDYIDRQSREVKADIW